MGKTLGDVPAGKVWKWQQAALMRLQLYSLGRTHKIFGELARTMRDIVLGRANAEGKLDGLGLWQAKSEIEQAWKDSFDEWKRETDGLRLEAARIPLGTVAILHKFQISNFKFQEAAPSTAVDEAGFVFGPQLRSVVQAANGRVYGDGLNWSGRVWQLDQEGLAGIQRDVYIGVANGDSAWDVAKRIEQYLGAGQDCSRWTRSRLYGLTKTDIASGDRTGLYSGDECASQGVAYKALRLARNEIQIAHHLATDAAMEKMPWIEQERIELSPAHPESDICDEVVGGGENGDGVYPKGTTILPLHVQCLCWKSAVMMKRDEFVKSLRGWMDGAPGTAGAWPEMDVYADWIGQGTGEGIGRGRGQGVSLGAGTLKEMGAAYVTWLWGGEGALKAAVERAVQLVLGL